MTDANFAALEDRLLRHQAVPGVPPGRRGDILDLVAECRRLRGSPDAAGLLTSEQLAAWQGLASRLAPSADHGPDVTWRAVEERDLVTARAGLPALLAHVGAQAALIRELYGVVADLHADDPGLQALLERGRAEGREQAARELELTRADPYADDAIPALVAAVRAIGPCRPPLPPQESEREAERLRVVLRPLLAFADYCQGGGHWRGKEPPPLSDADLAAARHALGGDAP